MRIFTKPTDITNLQLSTPDVEANIFQPYLPEYEWVYIMDELEAAMMEFRGGVSWFVNQVLAIHILDPKRLVQFMQENDIEQFIIDGLNTSADPYERISLAAALKMIFGYDSQQLISDFSIDLNDPKLQRYERLNLLRFIRLLDLNTPIDLPTGYLNTILPSLREIELKVGFVADMKLLFPLEFTALDLSLFKLGIPEADVNYVRANGNPIMLAVNMADLKIIHSSHSSITENGITFEAPALDVLAPLPGAIIY